MRLKTAVVAGGAGAAVLFAALLSAPLVAAEPAVSVRILFDFGDGTYVWAEETIPDPAAFNATWDAVDRAATTRGIEIETTWYPVHGVFVDDVGDRDPPGGVGVFEWNATSLRWQGALKGISTLTLRDGAAIALYDAGFTARTYIERRPVPTPDDPKPSAMFRGDLANSGLANSPAPHQVRPLWDRDTGNKEIGSTPAVAGGRVFVTTLGGILALDARTGTILWNNSHVRGFSSPAVFNDSVYLGTSAGSVVRLRATSGTVQWETRLLSQTGFTGISSSAKVVFDWLFIGTFNETGGAGEVVSLWEGNGTVRWRHATGSIHFSSVAYADDTLYVGVMGRYNTTTQITFDPPYGVLALDAASGQQRWFRPTGGSVAASPAILGPNVVVPSKDGRVVALNRTTGVPVWEAPVDAGVSSPAVFGDTVYVGGGAFGAGGKVTALDGATGSVRWTFTPNGPVQSSITYADGVLVFATNTDRGTVYGINATTGVLEWAYEPSPPQYILGSPVIADGIVYAPSDNGHVVALAQAPADVPPSPFGAVAVGGIAAGAVIVAVAAWVLLRRRGRHGE